MILRSLSIRNHSGEAIHFDLRYNEGTSHAPVIVLLHGFKGFKNWGFFPHLATAFAYGDYVTLTMNFSRNGISGNGDVFTDLEKFAENTISQELEDVQVILDAIREQKIGNHVIDPEKIGLFGHSRGGAVALLAALENPEVVKSVVTWASVARLMRYSPEQIEIWKKQGYLEVENTRTGQKMRINLSFLDDLEKNKEKFNLLERIKEIEAACLFIHGTEDTTVPPHESKQLYENCGSEYKRLELIEEANHTFGIKHPMKSVSDSYEVARDLSESWFDQYLKFF